ncbi:MAG: glycosyltransferase [Candidatus Methanomethylicia archaeon]|jgi:glycosyltransferase involved in cell wall biosynthesis|nr:glycosyltransferase [Candidatus Methanomethylicia archaeon]
MKILNAFNMVQDAYNVTKAMRNYGIDAHLLIKANDVAFANPLWEDFEIKESQFGDPLKPKKIAVESLPYWIKIIDIAGIHKKIFNIYKLKEMFDYYDFIFAHTPGPLYCLITHTRTPWIPYDAGLIRYLPFVKNYLPVYRPSLNSKIFLKLSEVAYKKAKRIIYTNPDTWNLFQNAGLEDKLIFIPFSIDCEKYKPTKVHRLIPHAELIFFMPSRHHWEEKGTDKVLRAFARLLKSHQETYLVMISWGTHLKKSMDLIDQLGITKNIVWLHPLNKLNLIKMFASVDVVLDQFTLGSWGTLTPEAMACMKPVIMYYNVNDIRRCFGDLPPILNAFTENEIFSRMEECFKLDLHNLGRESRKWVEKTHNPRLVVARHLQVIKEVLS